jgi:hypothetical protein
MPINVVCLKTGDKFNNAYVWRLYEMVNRNTSHDINFICYTDKPFTYNGITFMKPPAPHLKGWWGKVGFFKGDLPYGKTVYFDLDMLIVGNLDELFDFDADFALIKHWKKVRKFSKKGEAVPAYNSSCMLFGNPDARFYYYDTLEDEHVQRFRGDQDWIAYNNLNEKTFPPEWFVAYENLNGEPQPPVKVVICNVHDNHTIDHVPWVKEVWK